MEYSIDIELDLEEDEVIEKAKQSLTKPSDFGHWGNKDMFITWGFAGIDLCRGASLTDESNFKAFQNIVDNETMSDDFMVEGYNHWAVGHIDRFTVRVLNDEEKGVRYDNISDSFKLTLGIHEMLSEYPLIDEELYIEMDHFKKIDFLTEYAYVIPDMIDKSESGWEEKIILSLSDLDVEFCLDEDICPDDDQLLFAAHFANLINMDKREEWVDWCKNQDMAIPESLKKKEIEGQMRLELDND
jgi:hypothetical protein